MKLMNDHKLTEPKEPEGVHMRPVLRLDSVKLIYCHIPDVQGLINGDSHACRGRYNDCNDSITEEDLTI